MKKPAEIGYVVKCGYTSLKLIRLTRHGRDIKAESVAETPIEKQGREESEWVSGAAVSLPRLLSGLPKPRDVGLRLPAHFLIISPLTVPLLSSGKRSRVVSFEVRQRMPWAREEILWDFVDTGRVDNKTQGILVAAKKTAVTRLCTAIEECGVRVTAVEPGLMDLLRASHRVAGEPGAAREVLLHIDHEVIELVLSDGGILHARSIPVASSVTGCGSEETPDEAPTSTAVCRELIRSLRAWETGGTQRELPRIHIVDSGAGRPGALEGLLRRQGFQVAFCRYEAAMEFSSAAMEAGLPGKDHSPTDVQADLLPAGLRRRNRFQAKRPLLVASVACLWAAVGIAAFHASGELERLRGEEEVLQMAAAPLRSKDARLTAKIEQVRNTRALIDGIRSIDDRIYGWMEFLSRLQAATAVAAPGWIERLALVDAVSRPMLSGIPASARHGTGAGGEAPIRFTIEWFLLNDTGDEKQDTMGRIETLVNYLEDESKVHSVVLGEVDGGESHFVRVTMEIEIDGREFWEW